MNAAWADYRLVWRHAVPPSIARKAIWGICAAFAAGGCVLAYKSGGATHGPASVMLIVLPVLMMPMLYWLELVPGAVKQDTPANARLVPRLRVRALQLVGAYWALFTLAISVALGAAFGHPVLWAVTAAAWLAGSAMTRIGLHHGLTLWFVPFLMLMLPAGFIRTLQGFAAAPAGIVVCGLLIAALGWYAKRSLFPTGDRHFEQRGAVDKGVRMARERAVGIDYPAVATARGLYAFALARASHNRQAPGELTLHALGPAAHWSASANMLAVLSLVLVVGRVLLEFATEDKQEAVSFASGFVIFPVLLLFALAPQKIVERALATQGEQALLRLTPAVAHMGSYNLEIANALLRRVLVEWSILTTGLVAVTIMTGARWDIALLQFAVCCLALPLTTIVLRDYARSPALSQLYKYVGAAGLAFAAGAACFASLRGSPVVVSAVAITLGLSVTAVLAASRKRKMAQAPLAFPAGRLAS